MERLPTRLGFLSVSEIVRVLLIVGAVAVALTVVRGWAGYLALSRRKSLHTESLGPGPAVVLFTSADCDACDPLRDTVHGSVATDLFQEVKYQENAEQFRSVGINRVPAVVVIDRQGRAVEIFEGPVSPRQLGRAMRRAQVH